MNNIERYDRYRRQIILPGLGEAGQEKLLMAKVLVIGAGGLGCPALQYLAAAGVGTIGIIDDDTVSLTNLHRQVLYTMDDIGKIKAVVAASKLKQLNPDCTIVSYPQRLTTENALELIGTYDVVLDGTDNFATRYMVNDACVLLNKPLVFGAVSRFEGQVTVFNVANGSERGVNYRDIFPEPPADNDILNCEEAGVLGVLPGVIGCVMANETIKLITGLGQVLAGSLLTYNALNNQSYQITLSAVNETAALIPCDAQSFHETDYGWQCAAVAITEINGRQFNMFVNNGEATIIDVREIHELPMVTDFNHVHIPLSQLKEGFSSVAGHTLITFCQSGDRSKQAAKILFDTFGATKKVYSLQGGIKAWITQKESI